MPCPANATEQPSPEGSFTEIRVDWGSLAAAFSDDTAGVKWYLHAPTSQLLRALEENIGPEDFPAEEGFIVVDRIRSKQQYRWMVHFIAGLSDRTLAAQLSRAIAGKHAFHNFRAVLAHHPGRIVEWLDYRGAQLFERIRQWLSVQGLTVIRPDPFAARSRPGAAFATIRRAQLEDMIEALPVHDLRKLLALAEFLQANAMARAAAIPPATEPPLD